MSGLCQPKGTDRDSILSAGPSLFPGFVSFERGLNQARIEPDVGLPQPLHRLRQIQQPSRGRLFKQTNRSNHGQAAMNRRAPPGTVIHQNSGGFDFLREASGFRFSGIYAEREI